MRVLSKRTLREFWVKHPRAEKPMTAWYDHVTSVQWANFADVKQSFNSADQVGDRIVFNVKGNDYRIVAYVVYAPYFRVLIKFAGTHKDYDAIDPETV
ncbi:MAG: type II toxin-antitoxin system HigB family toxin [Maritimibacter sp.]|jgi:mRNA interferase HigB